MKISLFNNFGAKNSVPVFQAIRKGLKTLGHTVVEHDMNADAAVIWSVLWNGRMVRNQEVWQTYRSSNRPVIVAEVGMINRGITWKIGLNGTWAGCYNTDITHKNRADYLGLTVQPWTNSGSNIIIAVQRHDSEQWAGQPATEKWLQDIVHDIRQHSTRPIIARLHPRQKIKIPTECSLEVPTKLENTYDNFDFDSSLKNAWAVINHNSGPGSQSVIKGIPSFVGHNSLALPVANTDLSLIENPLRPDRSQWVEQLAHTEWLIEEITTGEPLLRLQSL